MKKLLTTIIPYYNAKQYCDELLKILDKQITKEVEVILIDDGSKEPYSPTYDWLTVVRKQNGGAASARNVGLDNATGEYVSFIDSDDIVAENYFDSILNKIKKEHFDYCYLSWKSFGSWIFDCKLNGKQDEFPDFNLCCWNRVYKRSIIGDVRFNINKPIAEDAEFIKTIQPKNGKKSVIADYMYFYRSDTPDSLTKRFNNGELTMKRTVYYFPHITKDMAWLIDEVKFENQFGEVIVMSENNELKEELKKYSMTTEPISIKGHELRGEYTSKFIKMDMPDKYKIVIWTGDIYKIGGMESFLYYFCKTMKDYYDITLVHNFIDDDQRRRLEKIVRLVPYMNQEISCDILVCDRITAKIPDTISYKKRIQMIHCYKLDPAWNLNTDCDLIVPVSENVKNSFKNQIDKNKCKVIKNIMNYDEPKRVLRLISCTRLSKEKGGERMLQFAKSLKKNNIPFLWTIFSNEKLSEDIEGISYMNPRLNVIDYIKGNDYLVQLSDVEAFGYSIAESLSLGVPVITTPIDSLDLIGLKDGENGFIVPFNMENIDIQKIYESNLKFNYSYDNSPMIDEWKKIFGSESVSNYRYDGYDPVYVQVIKQYRDMGTGDVHELGKRFQVTKNAARHLMKYGVVKMI